MDSRLLLYFQAVAEELSFTAAARRLRIAQPALSRAVKELENRLGVRLLHRTRRSVSLSPAGSVLLHEAGLLFQRHDESVRRVKRVAAGEEGELRLGFIGPPTQSFLGRLVRELRRLHPRVTVILEERTPERVWEMVASGRLAVGLTRPVSASAARGLKTVQLRAERLCAALPREHVLARVARVRWRALEGERLVILSRREGVGLHDTIVECCRRAGFVPRLAQTPSVVDTVLSYVEAGEGVGIIPESVQGLVGMRAIEFRPLTPAKTVELVVVWSPEHELPVVATARRLLAEWRERGEL